MKASPKKRKAKFSSSEEAQLGQEWMLESSYNDWRQLMHERMNNGKNFNSSLMG